MGRPRLPVGAGVLGRQFALACRASSTRLGRTLQRDCYRVHAGTSPAIPRRTCRNTPGGGLMEQCFGTVADHLLKSRAGVPPVQGAPPLRPLVVRLEARGTRYTVF